MITVTYTDNYWGEIRFSLDNFSMFKSGSPCQKISGD